VLRNNAATLMLSVLLISGCVRHTALDVDPTAEFNSARETGDYAKALAIVDRLSEQHPQYEALNAHKPAILRDIEQLQKRRIREADDLANSGRWREAFAILEELDKHWRDSELVAEARRDLEERQQFRLHQLSADLMVSEARWIQSRTTSIEQMDTLAETRARDTVRQLKERQSVLIREMTLLGHFFAERKDWTRTRDLLDAAHLLAGSTERDPKLVEAERQLASVASRQVRAASQRTRQHGNELIERYGKTRSIHDLIAARDYLQKNNRDGSLDDIATRLESLSRERFRAGLRQGDTLYASGNYAGAEKIWKEVAPLYPSDNELTGKMERVRKVLENLQSLGR
jgi:tetratricopeptide (TPR) repeat protein